MFKALYSHVNNIIEKYLQIYNHILLYLQWVKKEKIKTKATQLNNTRTKLKQKLNSTKATQQHSNWCWTSPIS